jgi:crotonobetainyl-CoA:carnitine CoA-transferase CaiB-like acyl-CoA transferase
MEQLKPLQGVKVVELSLMVAAATCGRMMADWGADVIKVENTSGGDNFRKWPAGIGAPTDDDFNPIFDELNANKRSLSVNLKTPEGVTIVYQLLEDADVLLTNFRTEALRRMHLDYETLQNKFPKLVVAQLIGYGEKGPEKDRPGYDNTAFWARGGFMYSQAIYSSENSYPVFLPMGFGDATCAMGLMAAAVSAVLSARATGKGDRVYLSLYGTAMWLSSVTIGGTQFGYHYPKTRELSTPFGAPFRCKDGRWFMPQIVNFARDFKTYYHLLGADDMIGNSLYAKRSNFNRQEVCEPVIRRFERIYAQKTAVEWSELFNSQDLSCEILYNYSDTLTDEQAIANDYVYTKKYGNGRQAKLIRPCLCSHNLGTPDYNRGPMLGEHTVSILSGLGYSSEEIQKLKESNVVVQHG